MSSTLYWRPTEERGKQLSDELKLSLRKRYGDPVLATLGSADIPYLNGMVDAEVPFASEVMKLMELIDKHGAIVIEEKYT